MARNKNGQIIPDDQDVNYGTNTAEVQKESTANLKAGKDKEKLDDLYSRYEKAVGLGKDELGKQIYEVETGKKFNGSMKQIPLQRYEKKYEPNIGVRGNDVWVKPETDKKPLPAGSSSGTDTTPLPKVEQEQIDVSNDATRQEKAQIKDAADEGRNYIRENNLVDSAKDIADKYDLYTKNIDTHYIDGLPRTIMQAWRNGKFGAPATEDAKKIRNALLTNEVGTMLSNMGAGIKGGEQKEGLWTASVRKNMEEADNRNNEKFSANMKNQLAQLDLSAKEQIELEKHINEIMADTTMAVAAKHANNIEDTIGLWHLKQALGESWNKMTPKQQMGFMNAVNAMQNGDTASGKAILHAALGDEGMVDIQKKMSDYTLKQSKANADMALTDAAFRPIMNGMNIVNGVGNLVGNAAKLAGL